MKTEEWTDFSVKLGGAGVKIIYASFQEGFHRTGGWGAWLSRGIPYCKTPFYGDFHGENYDHHGFGGFQF